MTFEVEEIKTIINQKFNELSAKIDKISSKDYPLSERYLDIQETCMLLNISKRSLQSYRDKGILPFCQQEGSKKVYFRAIDLENYLKSCYKPAFKNQ